MSNTAIQAPTKRQKEILDFLKKFQKQQGYAPSLAEIANNFSVSIPTIHQHVSYLRAKNLITAQKGKKRSIQILNNSQGELVEISLLGIIPAGGPIEAINNPEPLQVPRGLISKSGNHYALKVSGTSMIEEGISDGDIVIVREQQTINDGEKAVAYIPEKDAVTLKKIYHESGRVKLVPANKYMKPFYEKNVEIQGKVVGVLRKEF